MADSLTRQAPLTAPTTSVDASAQPVPAAAPSSSPAPPPPLSEFEKNLFEVRRNRRGQAAAAPPSPTPAAATSRSAPAPSAATSPPPTAAPAMGYRTAYGATTARNLETLSSNPLAETPPVQPLPPGNFSPTPISPEEWAEIGRQRREAIPALWNRIQLDDDRAVTRPESTVGLETDPLGAGNLMNLTVTQGLGRSLTDPLGVLQLAANPLTYPLNALSGVTGVPFLSPSAGINALTGSAPASWNQALDAGTMFGLQAADNAVTQGGVNLLARRLGASPALREILSGGASRTFKEVLPRWMGGKGVAAASDPLLRAVAKPMAKVVGPQLAQRLASTAIAPANRAMGLPMRALGAVTNVELLNDAAKTLERGVEARDASRDAAQRGEVADARSIQGMNERLDSLLAAEAAGTISPEDAQVQRDQLTAMANVRQKELEADQAFNELDARTSPLGALFNPKILQKRMSRLPNSRFMKGLESTGDFITDKLNAALDRVYRPSRRFLVGQDTSLEELDADRQAMREEQAPSRRAQEAARAQWMAEAGPQSLLMSPLHEKARQQAEAQWQAEGKGQGEAPPTFDEWAEAKRQAGVPTALDDPALSFERWKAITDKSLLGQQFPDRPEYRLSPEESQLASSWTAGKDLQGASRGVADSVAEFETALNENPQLAKNPKVRQVARQLMDQQTAVSLLRDDQRELERRRLMNLIEGLKPPAGR